jgi:hypothetical protein
MPNSWAYATRCAAIWCPVASSRAANRGSCSLIRANSQLHGGSPHNSGAHHVENAQMLGIAGQGDAPSQAQRAAVGEGSSTLGLIAPPRTRPRS